MADDQRRKAPKDGTVSAADDAQARLLELAELCHVCRVTFQATADRFHWRPAPGSAAQVLATALPSPDPLLAAPRVETGHRLVTRVIQTYLLTAAGHLGALSALYRTREVLFTPGMVVRGVIECSARVIWVLGGQNDRPEDRLARAYLEELLSAEEAKKAAGRLSGKSTEQYKSRDKAYKDLKAEIGRRFPGTAPDDLSCKMLGGQTLAKPGEVVTLMYDLLARHAGSVITSKVSQGIYDYLSNVTHPTLYPTRDLEEWVPSPDHLDELVTILHVDIDFVERQTAVAVLAYYNALSFVTSFFGWNTDVHGQLTKAIDRLLPGALQNPK